MATDIGPVVEIGDGARGLLLRYGSEQAGCEVPIGWRRRRNRTPHGCYAAAGRWAGHDDAVYTEGLLDDLIPHAWLTSRDGEVIDLALGEPDGRYLGVQIPYPVYARAVYKLGLWAPVLDVLADQGWTPGGDA